MVTGEERISAKEQARGRLFPRWALLLLAVALVAAGAFAYQAALQKRVTLIVGDEPPVVLNVRAWRVGDVLEQAGVVLNPGDRAIPAVGAFLSEGESIRVIRGKRVTLAVDGERLELSVPGETVRDVLVAADVRMGPLDRVEPVRETELTDGMEIQVIRVTQEEVVETEAIPYRTLRWAEPHLAKGEERLVREGQEGLLRSQVLITYENGEVAARKVLSREVVKEAVDEIVGVGTRESVQVLQTASGTYRYTSVKELEATAYYPGPKSTGIWADGYTYTGLRAGRGVVAVDPEVIPLGTRMYIPGYGEAIAADIGGAIKGDRIDLGFDTYEEAIQFGRKNIKVYILAD